MKPASLILAALLQMVPICRVATVSPVVAPSAWAWVMTWTAGAVAWLGSYDAVSGASAGISGLVKYSGATPVGTPTFEVAEPMGQSFRYRITVSNPGSDFDKNYFDCSPLAPGLIINTNIGAAGYVSGIPLEAGTYTVTLLAGNLNHPTPVTAEARITIYLPNAPPVIVAQPQDQSVPPGSSALLQAEVNGTPPLSFQWLRNGAGLSDARSGSLAFTNVQSADAGSYQLVVSNAFGVVTSAVARVTVREPFVVWLSLSAAAVSNGVFCTRVTGPVFTNYVIWGSDDLQSWRPMSTNWVTDGLLQFRAPAIATEPKRFYRASIGP